MYTILISIIILIAIIEIFSFIYIFEYYLCVFVYDQVPFVPTLKTTQKLIIQEIQKHFPNTKTICEIGSGYGSMARFLGKQTGAKVIALENMPISAILSKIADLCQNKSKTVKCDAFKYLDSTKQNFDIGVAFLSPDAVTKLLKYKNKINTLITVDFPINNKIPTKTINVGHGYTYYQNKKYPHKIFIYNFKK